MFLDIPVRFPLDNNKLVHHKFCLIDTVAPPTTVAPANMCAQASHVLQLPAQGVLITGSMNWTLNVIAIRFFFSNTQLNRNALHNEYRQYPAIGTTSSSLQRSRLSEPLPMSSFVFGVTSTQNNPSNDVSLWNGTTNLIIK